MAQRNPKQQPSLAYDVTSPAPLEHIARLRAHRLSLTLFWRTFFLLTILLIGSILSWLQTLRALELEPRAIQTAQQVASLVNLSRTALIHADAIARISLLKAMAEQEGVRILPREPTDDFELFDNSPLIDRITVELIGRLGSGTVVARNVNGEDGLWVGFDINGDQNWLLMDRARFSPAGGKTWLIWLATAVVLIVFAVFAVARNTPWGAWLAA